jgi:U6 snRNA-associated Sm-like protein LSm6
MSKKPSVFLQEIIGQDVVVKLNSGIEYRGTMVCLDGFMNIALENTVEVADGTTNEFGDCFIRGNNGMLAILYLLIFKCSSLHLSRKQLALDFPITIRRSVMV